MNMKKYSITALIGCAAFLLLFSGCASDTAKETTATVAADATKISIEELHGQEEKILTSYALLDAKKGTYRIPISKAMELIAAEAAK